MVLQSLGFFNSFFHSIIISCFLYYVKPYEQIIVHFLCSDLGVVPSRARFVPVVPVSELVLRIK